jgi:hypothetical protein
MLVGTVILKKEIIQQSKKKLGSDYLNFYDLNDKAVLFLEIERENEMPVTHLCSRKQLVWICNDDKVGLDVEGFKISNEGGKNIYLFVKAPSLAGYFFIGIIEKEKTEIGRAHGLRLPHNMSEIIITIKQMVPLDLWSKIGWAVDKRVYVNGLPLPSRIMEVIRDDAWSEFTNTETPSRFPIKIYRIELLRSLQKTLLASHSSCVDESDFMCIGRFKGKVIALNYSIGTMKGPSVYDIYGSLVQVADSVGEFEVKMKNGDI